MNKEKMIRCRKYFAKIMYASTSIYLSALVLDILIRYSPINLPSRLLDIINFIRSSGIYLIILIPTVLIIFLMNYNLRMYEINERIKNLEEKLNN